MSGFLYSFTYRWVEQPSGDPKEDPSIDGKRKAEAQADVEELGGVRTLGQIRTLRARSRLRSVGDLSAGECEESEILSVSDHAADEVVLTGREKCRQTRRPWQ